MSALHLSATRGSRSSSLKLHRVPGFGEVSFLPLQPQPRANPPIAGNGTGLAINNLTLVRAADLPRSTGRGGARNRADQERLALKPAQIANLKAAERHSRAISLPFTRMLTIHWKGAGVPLADMTKATGHFKELLTKWLNRKGHCTAWLWVHENGGDKGWHAHILAHVPAGLVQELTGKLRGWLRRITGRPYRANVIHSKPIGGRLGLEASNPQLHLANAKAALAYVCKGAPQSALNAAGIDRQHSAQGPTFGRRCSTSQNIAAKARKDWKPDG